MANEDAGRFRLVRELTNHWARSGPGRGHYWYLTVGQEPSLKALAAKCQNAIAFSYYDLVSLDGLHLTLDRLDHEAEMDSCRLRSIEAATRDACERVAPFTVSVGWLGGTSGAVGLSVRPDSDLVQLRETLRRAIAPGLRPAPASDSFHAHVSLAYSNVAGWPAGEVHAAVARISPVAPVEVRIDSVTLVALERRARKYHWEPLARIRLAG